MAVIDNARPDPGPGLRLVRRSGVGEPAELSAEQQSIVDNLSPRLRVLAGPGTGKTSALVAAVVDRIERRGVPAEQVLVLTYSRRAAAELSGRILARLGATTRAPLVRTLHSYAFSLVRAHAASRGEPPPRLIAAAESDQVIRDLLLGDAEREFGSGGSDQPAAWPPFLLPALRLRGFASVIRDAIARATERGVGPRAIRSLGRRHHRPEWEALGRFAEQYSDVLDLRTGTTRQGQALDQAELVGVALGLLRDDRILATEQQRIRRLFVDEYQDVDPAQAALVQTLAAGADELVVVGDPDQSIYAFRGADPDAIRRIDTDRTVNLTVGRRLPGAVARATRRIAAQLPGAGPHRVLVGAEPGREGQIDVRLFSSAASEAAAIADTFRRSHLDDGVPWSQMAVLARSPASALPALRRAFAVAGVPMVAGPAQPASEEPLVAALLLTLLCGDQTQELTAERAVELLSSPLGQVDVLGLRAVRRALRAKAPTAGSSTDQLAALLAGAPLPSDLPRAARRGLLRVRELLNIVMQGRDRSAEEVLWSLWQQSGQLGPLLESSAAGGLRGQRADTTLDAVLGLFEVAADRAALVPGAGIRDLLDAVLYRPPGTEETPAAGQRLGATDAVTVLSAHASKGLEWDVVAVLGVQEGTWPAQVRHGDLLGIQDLLDAAAGFPGRTDRSPALLADERRLFYVATSRARSRLLVSAVLDSDQQPSRFLAELAGTSELPVGRAERTRGLNATELIADLRRAVSDPEAPAEQRNHAARQLATLARHGYRAADPANWWGLAPRSTDLSPIAPGDVVRVSPSEVDYALRCSLRAALTRWGGRTPQSENQIDGMVTHALAAGMSQAIPRADLEAELDGWLEAAGPVAPWLRRRQRTLILQMLDAAQRWFDREHPPWQPVGAEVPILGAVPGATPDGHQVQIAGRIDLLSTDAEGRPVVVDFKTASTAFTVAEATVNPQLASYQVALAAPDPGTGADREVGGGRLVLLRTESERTQPPLTPSQLQEWRDRIRTVAGALARADQVATANASCDRCPVRICCPLQPDGQAVG